MSLTDYQQPGGRGPLRPVRFENVRLDDSFWSPWLKRIRAVSLPHLVETSGSLVRDFEYLAGMHQVQGAYTASSDQLLWSDMYVYNTLEAMAAGLA